MRLPPGFVPKELVDPNGSPPVEMGSVHLQAPKVEVSSRPFRLECLKFDGTDFWSQWLKLEQFFEADDTLDTIKIHTIMLSLEGRALDWHHFYAQRNEGIHVLTWPCYARAIQERFGSPLFSNPRKSWLV